jgi:trimethylamine-N-oxide reductase cytochrome c-type subunit TorC
VEESVIKRTWTAFWRPSTKWGLGVLVTGGIAVGVVGWNGFHWALEQTTTMEFCVSCHTMKDNNFEEYKTTIHYSNPAGVRAGCPDCHVPKSGWPLYEAKILAARDLWGEIVGTIDTREKFEEQRLALAQKVWDTMKATDSRECRSCHSFDAMDFEHQTKPDAAKQMQQAKIDGGTCIDCHKGIAHKLPDMSAGYKSTARQLKTAAASLSVRAGDTVYPIETIDFFVDKPADGAKPAGKVLPITALKVKSVDGALIEAELGGWQQQGAERVLYALQGKRIFNAVLTPAAVSKFTAGPAVADADTGQNWADGTMTVWVRNGSLSDSADKLSTLGGQMFNAACGSCHVLPKPDHYLANQWIGNLNAMKAKAPLDDEQFRLVQKYVQMNAKDVVGGGHE